MSNTCRFVLNPNGPIVVAYGLDHTTGYFISVTDTRLSFDNVVEELSEYHESCESPEHEAGIYLSTHTGRYGFGTKLKRRGMAEFWRHYGVNVGDVQKLLDGEAPVGVGAVRG